MKNLLIILIILIFGVLQQGCDSSGDVIKINFSGEAQGTYYQITYFAADTFLRQQEIDSLLRSFDLSASIWERNSVISKINRNDPEVTLDENFINIFKQAKRISEETNGAFDVTVGPLVNAWGFGFIEGIEINKNTIDSLLEFVDHKTIHLKDGKIIKDNPNIRIDFNAIAQGYSVDLTGKFIESKGIKNFLVDIGGEVLGKGQKPDGSFWLVGIEKPCESADAAREVYAKINIKNEAIATSGNYRKFYEKNGVRYSHTIDPKTGYPVKHSLLSATVIADSAAIADAYATSFMVMGIDKAKEFLSGRDNIEAYFIYSDKNGNLKTYATEGIRGKIKNN